MSSKSVRVSGYTFYYEPRKLLKKRGSGELARLISFQSHNSVFYKKQHWFGLVLFLFGILNITVVNSAFKSIILKMFTT